MTRMADLPTTRRHRLSDDDDADPPWGKAALRTPAARRRAEKNPERLVRIVTTNDKGQPTVRVQPANTPTPRPLQLPGGITIERDVPPPNGGYGRWNLVAGKMQPGDSVVVATKNEAHGLHQAIKRAGAKAMQRRELDGHIRVWRLT